MANCIETQDFLICLSTWVTRSQQGLLATYLILGALGEGSGWDLRVCPALAMASGNLESWKSGDLEIQEFGIQRNQKKHISVSKSKSVLPKISASSFSFHMQFFMDQRKHRTCLFLCYCPWWSIGCYFPWWSIGWKGKAEPCMLH